MSTIPAKHTAEEKCDALLQVLERITAAEAEVTAAIAAQNRYKKEIADLGDAPVTEANLEKRSRAMTLSTSLDTMIVASEGRATARVADVRPLLKECSEMCCSIFREAAAQYTETVTEVFMKYFHERFTAEAKARETDGAKMLTSLSCNFGYLDNSIEAADVTQLRFYANMCMAVLREHATRAPNFLKLAAQREVFTAS